MRFSMNNGSSKEHDFYLNTDQSINQWKRRFENDSSLFSGEDRSSLELLVWDSQEIAVGHRSRWMRLNHKVEEFFFSCSWLICVQIVHSFRPHLRTTNILQNTLIHKTFEMNKNIRFLFFNLLKNFSHHTEKNRWILPRNRWIFSFHWFEENFDRIVPLECPWISKEFCPLMNSCHAELNKFSIVAMFHWDDSTRVALFLFCRMNWLSHCLNAKTSLKIIWLKKFHSKIFFVGFGREIRTKEMFSPWNSKETDVVDRHGKRWIPMEIE